MRTHIKYKTYFLEDFFCDWADLSLEAYVSTQVFMFFSNELIEGPSLDF